MTIESKLNNITEHVSVATYQCVLLKIAGRYGGQKLVKIDNCDYLIVTEHVN